jgi:hypothetical protein
MDIERTKLDDLELLTELLALVGERLHVYTDYGDFTGSSSFTARLDRVQPVNSSLPDLLLSFKGEVAHASLGSPRMAAWKVRNQMTGNQWLEFTIRDRRVVDINRLSPGGLDGEAG